MTAGSAWRRRLITVAVRDYPREGDGFRQRISDQVETLAAWFANPALQDRQFQHADGAPRDKRSIEDFVHEHGLRELGPADVVVLYITGHGVQGGSGSHYLMFGASDEDQPLSGYRTVQLLAEVLAGDAEHLLVLVDSCHAGALEAELALVRKDLPMTRRRVPSLAVITSADFDEKARIGEFASLLRLVYERLRSSAQIATEHMSFEQLATEIRAVLHDHREITEPLWVWSRNPDRGESLCLPNPGFQPLRDVVDAPRRQVAVTEPELDYWLGRAAGRVAAYDPGWYFSGRQELMRNVASFVQDGNGILVITGAAGTGKSAVLARTVTLSDPVFLAQDRYAHLVKEMDPDSLPAPGSVDAAVLARNKDSEQVAADLASALGYSNTGAHPGRRVTDLLLGQLRSDGRTRTVVIDGVDEAREPGRLISDLLGPLARVGGRSSLVRLVLGLRSSRPDDQGAAVDPGQGLLDLLHRATEPSVITLFRTDEQPAVTHDITAYVDSLLCAEGPYAPDGDARTAAVLAAQVTPSFLDARLAGQRLREAPRRQDLDDPRWLATLADGTLSLFREDLVDVAEDLRLPVDWLLAVLRATAFAQGRGLPWSDVWPAVAGAVLDDDLPNADAVIRAVLDSRLSGYLTQDVEDDRIVHRPSHERLAEALRDAASSLRPGGAATERA
jgi:AAA domain